MTEHWVVNSKWILIAIDFTVKSNNLDRRSIHTASSSPLTGPYIFLTSPNPVCPFSWCFWLFLVETALSFRGILCLILEDKSEVNLVWISDSTVLGYTLQRKQTQSLLSVLLLMNTIPAAHIRASGLHLRGVWMYSISGKTDYGLVIQWPHRVPRNRCLGKLWWTVVISTFTGWLAAEGHIQWCVVRSWLMPWIIRSLWLGILGGGSPTLRGSFAYNTLLYPGSTPVKLTHSKWGSFESVLAHTHFWDSWDTNWHCGGFSGRVGNMWAPHLPLLSPNKCLTANSGEQRALDRSPPLSLL